MTADDIAEQCVRESGAKGYKTSKELSLLGLAIVPDGDIDKPQFKQDMKAAFVRARGKEYGFVFMAILLPLLISIVANWIVKWIWDHKHKDRSQIRQEAVVQLCGLSPSWMDTLTSINSPPTNHTGQQP